MTQQKSVPDHDRVTWNSQDEYDATLEAWAHYVVNNRLDADTDFYEAVMDHLRWYLEQHQTTRSTWSDVRQFCHVDIGRGDESKFYQALYHDLGKPSGEDKDAVQGVTRLYFDLCDACRTILE